MAKKDKKKKDKKGSGATDPVEAVRSAVERTLKATGEGTSGAQKRGRDLVDEVAHAAARFRDAMGDLKVLDDLKAEVASLKKRVAALEGRATSAVRPSRTTATKTATTRSRSTAAKSTAAKPAASRAKSSGTTSRSRSTATKRSATKPASTRSRSTSKRSTTRPRSTGSSGSSSS